MKLLTFASISEDYLPRAKFHFVPTTLVIWSNIQFGTGGFLSVAYTTLDRLKSVNIWPLYYYIRVHSDIV